MQWNPKNLSEFESAIAELFDLIISRKNSISATTVCLHGDLGAGKTTATQIIGKLLDVTEIINSPTFVIKKIYQTHHAVFKTLIHIDAYRLENEKIEMLRIDQDFKNPDNLIIIEWPEMISEIIPIDAIHMYIEHREEGREIQLK